MTLVRLEHAALCLESSTQSLSHCATKSLFILEINNESIIAFTCGLLKHSVGHYMHSMHVRNENMQTFKGDMSILQQTTFKGIFLSKLPLFCKRKPLKGATTVDPL